MKIELQNSYFNEETGESIAIYNTDLGSIIGKAKLHPEEKYPSKYFGQEIARRRGIINYCKRKMKSEKNSLQTINILYNNLINQTSYYIMDLKTTKVFLKRIEKEREIYIKNINFYADVIEKNNMKIEELLKERELTLDKFYEKKAKQNG